MKINNNLYASLLILLLAGCAKSVTGIKQDIVQPIADNHGYLLISVDTNYNLQSINLEGQRRLSLTTKDLQRGTNYILLNVPAGNYRLSKVTFNNMLHFRLTDSYWDFSVGAGRISYVGNFNIKANTYSVWRHGANLVLENRSSDALQFLERSFPTLLQAYSVRYHGPGEDDFFQHIEHIAQSVSQQ
ncbi:hypothetical protein [Arsukibacterium sp.]|uniref:hypothetical protein n=1 Tax=Arsukibacterium sp. TaxID=1977258 RepID=UPI002FD96A0F